MSRVLVKVSFKLKTGLRYIPTYSSYTYYIDVSCTYIYKYINKRICIGTYTGRSNKFVLYDEIADDDFLNNNL